MKSFRSVDTIDLSNLNTSAYATTMGDTSSGNKRKQKYEIHFQVSYSDHFRIQALYTPIC